MWTKICANTNLEDARLAAELGAHAVGFIFARSTREVTPALAAAISAQLPPTVERIGVFDTGDPHAIAQTIGEATLTGAQLHGPFNPELAHRLDTLMCGRIIIIQTIHWNTALDATGQAASVAAQLRKIHDESPVSRVLIDSRVGAATGGTGIPFDWNAASAILHANLGPLKLIVAGGLSPGNVETAMDELRPWGVDVASGVESAPGKKDPQKLKAFLGKASRQSL